MQWFTEALVSENRTSERLRVILRGAFDGPPKPLKDIPKRNGDQRAKRKEQPKKKKSKSSSASSNE
jgi:prophage tail gpP-like protein